MTPPEEDSRLTSSPLSTGNESGVSTRAEARDGAVDGAEDGFVDGADDDRGASSLGEFDLSLSTTSDLDDLAGLEAFAKDIFGGHSGSFHRIKKVCVYVSCFVCTADRQIFQ